MNTKAYTTADKMGTHTEIMPRSVSECFVALFYTVNKNAIALLN